MNTASIIVNTERLKSFKIRNQTGMPMFATSTCHSTENPSQRSQARKRHKRHKQTGEEEVKLSLLTHTHTHRVEKSQSPNSNSLHVCHTT